MVAVVLASFQEGAMHTSRDDGRQAALLQAASRAEAQGREPKRRRNGYWAKSWSEERGGKLGSRQREA